MFKKAVEAKSHQRLSGADRKKLRRTVKDLFPRASDADIDTLLPPKVFFFVCVCVCVCVCGRLQIYNFEYPLVVRFALVGFGINFVIFLNAKFRDCYSDSEYYVIIQCSCPYGILCPKN
jgi:hypothetical protein